MCCFLLDFCQLENINCVHCAVSTYILSVVEQCSDMHVSKPFCATDIGQLCCCKGQVLLSVLFADLPLSAVLLPHADKTLRRNKRNTPATRPRFGLESGKQFAVFM